MRQLLKTSTLVILLFLSNAAQAAKVLVFSDVDDTIKISYVRNKIEMISYSVFADSLVYGMDQAYRAMAKQTKAKFTYLSNGWTPTVAEVHQKLISDFDFPAGQYISRDNPLVKSHKLDNIRRILKEQKPDSVILIGDNGEKDPYIYHQIVNEFSSQGIEFKTFIHKAYDNPNSELLQATGVSAAGLFPEQREFLNAAELAYLFNEYGVIDGKTAFKIIEDVERALNVQKQFAVYGPLVMPFYQSCAPSSRIFMGKCRSSMLGLSPFQVRLESIRKKMCSLIVPTK